MAEARVQVLAVLRIKEHDVGSKVLAVSLELIISHVLQSGEDVALDLAANDISAPIDEVLLRNSETHLFSGRLRFFRLDQQLLNTVDVPLGHSLHALFDFFLPLLENLFPQIVIVAQVHLLLFLQILPPFSVVLILPVSELLRIGIPQLAHQVLIDELLAQVPRLVVVL